ncbi:MAG: RHS repeat-associated core domain-containing protein, partial [Gemmatimonadota bacterium]
GSGTHETLVRESLHVVDDQRRIALVETRTDGGDTTPAQRYQLADHLGSESLELAEDGAVISYEEYHPYGTTAFQCARSAGEAESKRYRYIGEERDGETGLHSHGARHYASWLGRWTSADPAGLIDGSNLYRFTRNNPVMLTDRSGLGPDDDEDPVDLGPFRLSNLQLTGLSGGARLRLGLQGLFSSDPVSLSVESASLAGRLDFSSDLAIPSLGLEGGTGDYHLNLSDISVDSGHAHADIRGRARLDAGPLSLSIRAYADLTTRLDERIVVNQWQRHAQRSLEATRGNVDVFATPRIFGHEVGFFALRAETEGGGEGTTSLSGRLGLGDLTLGNIQGAGTFSAGFFLDDEWVPGSFNLAGDFSGGLPPLAYSWGSWSFDLNRGLEASGHYLGLQVGPIDLNPEINPTGNVTDDTSYWRHRDALDAGAGPLGGEVPMFEPGPGAGYTYFDYSESGTTIFSVGASFTSSIVPYSPGGASRPFANPSLGPFFGALFSRSF